MRRGFSLISMTALYSLIGCVPNEPVDNGNKTVGNLDLYSQQKVVVIHSNKKLSAVHLESLDEFKKSFGYYSAFAVNIAEDFSIWTDHNSLQAAKVEALGACKLKSNDASGCIVYASIIPKGYTPKEGSITLGSDAMKIYKGAFLKSLRNNKYGAFAVNQNEGYGWGVGISKEKAIEAALEACAKYEYVTMYHATETWRKYLKPHHFKCHIVDVRS